MSDPFNLLSHIELQRRRARLLHRIHQHYQTKATVFPLGPLRLEFTRVADPDVVLDEVVAEEDRRERSTGVRRDGNELHMPYWAELWDSALGIGEFLAANDDRVTRWQGEKVTKAASSTHLFAPSPLHILDLGCGMGFAGMVAAAMGHHVLLVDIEAPALLFARLNTLPYLHRTRIRRLNWQSDRLGEQFDLILGADVLYDKTQWEFLEHFWRAHLYEGGTVLLGEPGRQTGDMFVDWIAHRGWTLQPFEQPLVSRARPIRLFNLTR